MTTPVQKPLVGVIMGSRSDWPTLAKAAEILAELGVPHEAKVVSAHRTPDRLVAYARSARARGLKVIIAGAGGAAHLPGMVASMTSLPVLGVPVKSSAITYVPKTKKALSGRDAELCMSLFEALDDHDDSQNVYADFDVADDDAG